MIVTITLNPVLHVRYDAEAVEAGVTNQVSRAGYAAGGRGLAVARLLHTFGHEVVAAGLAGGSAGELIRNELAKAGVATQFTVIGAESRRILSVRDRRAGRVTGFAEPAPYITTEELGRLAADYRGLLDGASAVVLCGSLPDGLPAETYGSLVSYAAEAGVPVVLDAAGSALRHGAARRPTLVIPEPPVDQPYQAAAGAAGFLAAGDSSVVLQAERGVLALTGEGEWHAELPGAVRWPASRDALVAGFVPGVALAWSWDEMLRHSVALAASVQPDEDADLAGYERLLPEVVIAGPVRSTALMPDHIA
jgi:tagatose 6-phosphate kinase